MNIELEIGIVEAIYIYCKEKEKKNKIKFWSKTIKLHLKYLEIYILALFIGTNPFIMEIDGCTILRKIYKSWDSVAQSTLLFVEIDHSKLYSIVMWAD